MVQVAAIIGGGVIGGGWAARFALMGWQVRVLDPDPEAERKIGEVLHNARRSLPGLADAALPPEGGITFCTDAAVAVSGADWIQESVPERLEVKQAVYRTLQEHAAEDAVIASSTSGFKPSELQDGALRPGQILVAHPFNPVYLLPVVELVGTTANPPDVFARADAFLKQVGMYPLRLEHEIDAHIADRLMEAVWREALWLVNDGVATTQEIDDVIRLGFGLRWAQMGLFETYRIAGGEQRMRPFLHQFGPALKWPWTKLMDVPDLDETLIDTIAGQSDAQSGQHTIRELERQRDTNLVALMRALKSQNWGAGAVLNATDAILRTENGMVQRFENIRDLAQPILTLDRTVPLDWTDYNGHMNEAKYLQAFGDATDRFMEIVGCDAEYIATGGSYFTAETHIRHLDEIHAGHRIRIETTCLEGRGRKMHIFHELWEGERLCATGEHFLLHVSLDTRRPSEPSEAIQRHLAAIEEGHKRLPRPEGLGRYVGQAR